MVNNTENRITDEEIERIVNVVLNKVNDKKNVLHAMVKL